jgi:predicted Zn-dependent protease
MKRSAVAATIVILLGAGLAVGQTATRWVERTKVDVRAGFRYARDAGYDAAGLRDFLSALLDRDGERDATRATFFSTHPGTRERRDEQSRLLASAPPGGRRNPDRCVAAVRF